MVEEAARRRVRMDVDVEGNLPPVAFDRIQVQQVLMNLIRNSMEAMDSVAGDRVLGMRVRRMGDAVRTEISDRGQASNFLTRYSSRSSRRKRTGWAWGSRSAARLSSLTADGCGGDQRTAGSDTYLFTLPVEVNTAS
jgi:light-regulated signal transduction histidine kinase (bacteriophytochrome)